MTARAVVSSKWLLAARSPCGSRSGRTARLEGTVTKSGPLYLLAAPGRSGAAPDIAVLCPKGHLRCLSGARQCRDPCLLVSREVPDETARVRCPPWCGMSALQAQQPLQSHRIAIVASALPSDMTEVGHSPFFRVFSAELRRLGYIEGHNLIFERYSTWGLKEPFSEVAASVVRQNPDLILAIGSRVVRALKLATTVIPIVGVMSDPVAFGIVKRLNRPGDNITGVSPDAGIELPGKQLDLLKELLRQPRFEGRVARHLRCGGERSSPAPRNL